ncbi:MAG: galactose mutarotase [Pirellulaceae bacterium]|nr:galactose mutarotase [Pirellulaceae bacterium]
MKLILKHVVTAAFCIIAAATIGCPAGVESKKQSGPITNQHDDSPGESEGKMNIKQETFGKTPDGETVDLYTLTNTNGLRIKIMTYGATIVAVETPDREGRMANITLALDSLDDYLKEHPYLGSTVGRYANRIAKGKFSIEGREYTLAANDGSNHLHGGTKGFDKAVWKAEPVEGDDFVGVRFTHESPDGDEGYPGKLSAAVTYSLTKDNELRMEYEAETDAPTVINLTNHTYWNLAGGGKTDVLEHTLTLNADRYLPADAGLIPLGELKPVKDTPMDFTQPMTIGSRIKQVDGYDHCYVLNKVEGETAPTFVAKITEPSSGRVMEIFTTQPGVQFYTGNFLDGSLGGGGAVFQRHYGFCLETQHYPDSPNQPEFPITILRPGEKYRHTTIHKFGVE